MIDPALRASSALQQVSLQVATTGERYSHCTEFDWLAALKLFKLLAFQEFCND